jgi:hypothetical protein
MPHLLHTVEMPAPRSRPYVPRARAPAKPRPAPEPVVRQYTRTTGRQLTYDVTVDGFGNWWVRLGGKLLKRGDDLLVATQADPAWRRPLKRREDEAFSAACFAIDRMFPHEEE